MRAIFLTLVVINLVLLPVLWWQSKTEAPAAVASLPKSAAGGERLVLLSELDSAAAGTPATQRQRQPAAPSDEAPLSSSEPLCTLVGPFKKELSAEYFVERLQALDVLAAVTLLEVPGSSSYWVYQRPESSRKAALRLLHELQAKGIDSYVIPKGDLANGVSFGLYNERKRADDRVAEIRGLGYEAQIRTVTRTFEESWVTLKAGEAEKISRDHWLELLNRESGLEKRENYCPPVASS